jgi:predicted TIM-barrel fold metal-dependent hydrolase
MFERIQSRRKFLCSVGYRVAGAIVLPKLLRAAGPQRDVVDVHYHVTTSYMRATANDAGVSALPEWSEAKAIEAMDRDGIATSVISMPVMATQMPGGAEQHRNYARSSNEESARIVGGNPSRFRFFASTALPFVDETLAEIAYALDVLKADGIYMCTSYGDKWLGDAAFRPVMEELNRRGAVVFTHPMGAACCTNLQADVPVQVIEYGTDTTRTIASLIFSGTAHRFPQIRFLFSHSGGTAPYLFERFNTESQQRKDVAPEGAIALMQKFYYDTATSANPYALGDLIRLVPRGQILFGSDSPWLKPGPQLKAIDGLGFDAATVAAIRGGNARGLLPGLRA